MEASWLRIAQMLNEFFAQRYCSKHVIACHKPPLLKSWRNCVHRRYGNSYATACHTGIWHAPPARNASTHWTLLITCLRTISRSEKVKSAEKIAGPQDPCEVSTEGPRSSQTHSCIQDWASNIRDIHGAVLWQASLSRIVIHGQSKSSTSSGRACPSWCPKL